MNEARDIQHPDITAAEQTGYPLFPRKMEITIPEDLIKEYCNKAFDSFWYFLTITCPDAITGFLDDYPSEFNDFIVNI